MIDSAGNPINFWITDDLTEMDTLNNGDHCYIYTESENDVSGKQIAVRTNSLPQYINCMVDSSDNVTHSLDFGLPKEVYFGLVNYDESATIYANF